MRKPYTRGTVTIEEILKNTVTGKNGCINWTGSVSRGGYGHLRRKGKLLTVTRLVMYLKNGFDYTNRKLFVLHHCDNPRCINIDHLYIGDCQDNANDRKARKRGHQGEQHKFALFSNKKIEAIRRDYANGVRQQELCSKYGVEQSYISRIVNNKARAL